MALLLTPMRLRKKSTVCDYYEKLTPFVELFLYIKQIQYLKEIINYGKKVFLGFRW